MKMLIITCDNPICDNAWNVGLEANKLEDGITLSDVLPPNWSLVKMNISDDSLGATIIKCYCRECCEKFISKETKLIERDLYSRN